MPLDATILGGAMAISAIMAVNSLLNETSDHAKVIKCVEAYYSDKYNGYPTGAPVKSFHVCMEKNFPNTFRRAEEKYKPVEQNQKPQQKVNSPQPQ